MTENQHLPRSILPTKTKLGPLALFAGLCAFSQAVAAGADTEALAAAAKAGSALPLVQPRQPDGNGTVAISGELKQWHKVTLTLDGPFAHERDNAPNPFTDLALQRHLHARERLAEIHGARLLRGRWRCGELPSADSGTKWRAHLSPDKAGKWNYAVSFAKGKDRRARRKGRGAEAVRWRERQLRRRRDATRPGATSARKGRLQYVGEHYLQFAGIEGILPQGRRRCAGDAARLCGLRRHGAPSETCSGAARPSRRRRSRPGSRMCRTGRPAIRRGRTARARA